MKYDLKHSPLPSQIPENIIKDLPQRIIKACEESKKQSHTNILSQG